MRVRVNVTLVLLVAFLIACGGNQRQKTLRASFTAVTAACDGLEAWDTERQAQIVAAALSKEEGRKKLDEHRASIDKVYAVCPISIRAITTAAFEKDDLTFKAAVDAAEMLFESIRTLKGAL